MKTNTLSLVALLAVMLILLSLSAAARADQVTLEASTDDSADDAVNDTADVPPEENPDFMITAFSPSKPKMGDVIFNIDVKNTGNVRLKDLVPIVSGDGFSTYDLVPISSIDPGETSKMFVMGRLDKAGEMILSVKLGTKIFYVKLYVEGGEQKDDTAAKEAEERRKLEMLAQINIQYDELKENYTLLESDYSAKKSKYDVSEVNLEDLKEYLRSTQSSIIAKDPDKANISINLALTEYADQKRMLDNAQKKPFLNKIKENILVISTIAGSIITLVTLMEIFGRKKEKIYEKVKNRKSAEAEKGKGKKKGVKKEKK